MTDLITCINGRFLPENEVKLPISDRGFRFGDGVFETIRLAGGVPYQWELHLARMKAGLNALRIDAPVIDWAAQARQVIQKNKVQDGFLRISISRGNGGAGYLPSADSTPNWVIEYVAARPLPGAPYKLWVSSQMRPPLNALPGNHKLAQGIGSTLALMEAADHGCEEALQRSSQGVICCAASANIFWIKGKTIFTPSLGTGCLSGTMRAAVMRCSPAPVHECEDDLSTLENADAVFITNSRLTVWPVSAVEPLSIRFNEGQPLIQQLSELIHVDIKSNTSSNIKYWSQL